MDNKTYTVDIYNHKEKRVIDLRLVPMTYRQALTFRSKFPYRKHYD